MITQRQEIFCNQVFLGKTATEAALIAGYSPKWAATHTTAMLKKANVYNRLLELRAGMEKNTIGTVGERLELLTKVYRSPMREPISAKETVLAIAEHNKMDGSYAPERHQVDLNVDVVFQIGKGYIELSERT